VADFIKQPQCPAKSYLQQFSGHSDGTGATDKDDEG
jgi:hypothetical protein